MKSIFKLLTIVFLTCVLNSCSDYNSSTPYAPAPTSNTSTFSATLAGTSEVPSNASTATGTATLTYNNSSKIFSVTVNYSGMTVNSADIAKGADGVSGPTVFSFSTFTSPISYTSVALDATQEADLNSNLYYINLHSTTYSGGEIRGQLIKQTSSPY